MSDKETSIDRIPIRPNPYKPNRARADQLRSNRERPWVEEYWKNMKREFPELDISVRLTSL
jgi:hypothetical protein